MNHEQAKVWGDFFGTLGGFMLLGLLIYCVFGGR